MFENIIGHDEQKKLLEEMIKKDNISHAYLFSGNDGIGKYLVACEFAKSILKTKNLETSADFKVISKLEDKKEIVIEQIRKEIIDDLYVAPAMGDKKIYIINNAEYLNIASQNALLKTLEEPPKYVIIILISSNTSAFLTTVMSRLNNIPFEGVKKEEIKEYILKNYNENLSDNILDFVDGSIGNAITIIENEYLSKFEKVDLLFDFVSKKNVIEAMKKSQDIDFKDTTLLDYLEFISYKNGKYSFVKFIERAKTRLKYNGNYDIVIDTMLINMAK